MSAPMSANVGTIDRLIRAVVGLVLIALPFVGSFALFQGTWATALSVIVGLVLLTTASLRFCPAYRLLGLRTCRA